MRKSLIRATGTGLLGLVLASPAVAGDYSLTRKNYAQVNCMVANTPDHSLGLGCGVRLNIVKRNLGLNIEVNSTNEEQDGGEGRQNHTSNFELILYPDYQKNTFVSVGIGRPNASEFSNGTSWIPNTPSLGFGLRTRNLRHNLELENRFSFIDYLGNKKLLSELKLRYYALEEKKYDVLWGFDWNILNQKVYNPKKERDERIDSFGFKVDLEFRFKFKKF